MPSDSPKKPRKPKKAKFLWALDRVDLETPEGLNTALIEIAAQTSKDPLKFVQLAFPWGKDTLSDWEGPTSWQVDVLTSMRDYLRRDNVEGAVSAYLDATAAGNGVGKSALVAWITLWSMATFPDTRGIVTANTDTQLRTKTFSEISKWFHLCLFSRWFQISATCINSRQKTHTQTWRFDAIPWSESRPEGFAGLHNAKKRLMVIFDEASAISNVIWETVEGAMTDRSTQIFWMVFGNPTRNSGRFFDCFNKYRHRWIHRHVDSRTVPGIDKAKVDMWVQDYGINSDWVRVHVLGQFPNASDLQFIPRAMAEAAMKREKRYESFFDKVAILGVDVARDGNDKSVICCRVGTDARTYGMRTFRNMDGPKLAAAVKLFHDELVSEGAARVIVNIDVGGVGASPYDFLKDGGFQVNPIQFGSEAYNVGSTKYLNLRAEMWGKMRKWLKEGGCIEDNDDLLTDLTGVEYGETTKGLIKLESKKEMKERGLSSPDMADALALTFAVPINEILNNELDDEPPVRSRYQRQTRDPYADM